jgi:hypothetical protein
VDSQGHAYITGSTTSTNFPTTTGAYKTTYGGGSSDAFVTEVNAAGSGLVYSTDLGGSNQDSGAAIALDSGGTAYVTGLTNSTNFPTASAFQSSLGGSPMSMGSDAFVTAVAPGGASLSWSSFLGGTDADQGNGIALDVIGRVYVTGATNSPDFPTLNPYQGSLGGGGMGGGPSDAFLTAINQAPAAPVITAISPDTGSSSSDFITDSQNLTLSGTAPASSTVTLYRPGLGSIGTATANTSGAWSFNYTGTTLPEGTYAFWATATVSGVTSANSATRLVTVDLTAPTVTVSVPATTSSLSPVVTVTAGDTVGLPPSATVTLDVDLNNNGTFTDPGEAGYATGTLTNGLATITLPALPATGTYRVRAHVTDLAGNAATSAAQSFTVTSSSWGLSDVVVRSSDPNSGMAQNQLGDVSVSHPLDLDLSPGTDQSGNPALVYNSDSVHVRPIAQATLTSDNSTALPSQLGIKLVWAGTTQTQGGTVDSNGFRWLSTSAAHPGDLLTLAAQVDNAVSSTGRYAWTVSINVNGTIYSQSGTSFVRVEDCPPCRNICHFSGLNV